jgi:hypothetical protein
MAKWDIDPAGVSGVVGRTGQRAAGFDEAAGRTGSALGGAAGSCGSEIVAAALAGFAANKAAAIDAVGQRTARILAGAVEASTAYVEGDLEMAATAQANATAVGG